MRRKAMIFATGLMVAGSMAIATPAHANCVGTDRTIVVCVNPTGQTLYEDCVHVVVPPCVPVSVPGPTFSCGGDIGERIISC